MEVSTTQAIFLIIGGFLAGIINTLAGNGSAITLSLLLGLGLDATLANATNRVGAALQTATSILSLRKSKRNLKNRGDSIYFIIPSIIGSIIGAYFAIETPPLILKYVIGVVMLFLLGTLLFNPKKWLKGTNPNTQHKSIKNWFWFFAVGLYAGFIQMGIGILMLSILVLIVNYSIRDGNIIKLYLAFFMTVPAFFVYALSGDIVWVPGLLLAIGAIIGAWFGARFMLTKKWAVPATRWLLIVVITIAIIRIFLPLFQ